MAKERLGTPRARLFVALDLPEEIRAAIVAWQGGALEDPALRPMRPESLHLTLVFLGYHPEKEIDEIASAALIPRVKTPELTLRAEPVGVPRGRHPRLFALDAESPAAVALQGRVSDSLRAAGFYEPEKRPFWPHLTVARVRPEKRGSKRPARVETPPKPLPPGFEHTFGSDRLTLYRSHLRPQGAEYEPLAQLELKP
ncbi:MAG: 2,3-cyclic 3-phosphodiesterase [Solirubrobacterales bacterium]|jgi:2'-5' RNA ligase|nr:2,3-cyclic 3-phosphodiesterase [Solirubrobacterales bacterium]